MSSTALIRFTKMQGIGNDFVVMDAREQSLTHLPQLAIRVCDRHFGIGSDGLLVIERSAEADGRMRMFNPDGTEDMCGNGLRCVARYVADERRTTNDQRRTTLRIETLAGIRDCRVNYLSDGRCEVTVEMGDPRFTPAEIPMDVDLPHVIDYPLPVGTIDLPITAVNTGSTHAVTFVEELPEDYEFAELSRLVENHALFPERTSLMWARIDSRDRISLRIWERGVGETLGCGTGACAAAVAAIVNRLADSPVTVASKGGELRIDWHEGSGIRMTGPAEYVFSGEISQDA